MSFKSLVKTLSLCAFVFAFTAVAFGQVEVKGTIMKNNGGADYGPVAGVKILCIRADIDESCGEMVTGADGKFSFKGFPKEAKIGFGLSGPNLTATFYPEFGVSEDRAKNLYILVRDGDGQDFPVDQLRANVVGEQLSAEEKKERDEGELENQRRFEGLFDVKRRNELRDQYFKDGEAAFKAKDFDKAVENFHNGYEIDPKFLGSAPGFLNNKGISLVERAVSNFNKAKGASDVVESSVMPDLLLALESAFEARELVNGSLTASGTKQGKDNLTESEKVIKLTFKVLSQMKLPLPANSEEEAGRSVGLYKQSLEVLPEDMDIMGGLMLALFNVGAFSGDESNYQESLNYGAHFLEKAPKSHPQHAAVTEIVNLIKTQYKMNPKSIK